MEKINLGRVILGGIVAGIVANVLGYVVDGVVLASQWAEGLRGLGKPDFSGTQIASFMIIGLASGIFAIWLYAAIRPRYGAGPKTAVLAGVATWVIGVLLPNVAFMGVVGLFSTNLVVSTTVAGLVEWAIAALAGAALYTEGADTARSMAARV